MSPAWISLIITGTLWEMWVYFARIPEYIIPAPSLIIAEFCRHYSIYMGALWYTAKPTLVALLISAITGYALGLIFTLFPKMERALFPFTSLIQTTPMIVVAPLLMMIFEENRFVLFVICAWFSSVFPIISATQSGLKSINPQFMQFFKIHGASPWQIFWYLRFPSSLPYFLNALKVSGPLALLGTVGSEFLVGPKDLRHAGLALQIFMASGQLEGPRLFAVFMTLSFFGLLLFMLLHLFSAKLLKRFHRPA